MPFPGRCVYRRTKVNAEIRLGSLPGLLLTPTAAALLATAWALLNPSKTTRINGHLVLVPPTFGEVVEAIVVGGVLAVVVVGSVVLGSIWARYRLGTWDRASWEVSHSGDANLVTFELSPARSRTPSPLVQADCWVKDPSGNVLQVEHASVDLKTNTATAQSAGPVQPGTYEVRWYATRNISEFQEITRGNVTVRAPARNRCLEGRPLAGGPSPCAPGSGPAQPRPAC
jgi:hypothetical protein